MAPKKNLVNKPTLKPARADPAVYPASSTSINVTTHPYGTRAKIKSLFELYDQTSPVLNQNLLFETFSSQDSEEVPAKQLNSGSSPTYQKSSNEQDICSSSSSKP